MDSESIIQAAKLYADRKGLKLSTVSTYTSGSGDTFDRMMRGHTITMRRAKRIISRLSDHWPSDLPWPSDIPRPPQAKDDAA